MDSDEGIDDEYSDNEFTMVEESKSQTDCQELDRYKVLTTEQILGHMNEDIMVVQNVVQVWNSTYFLL